MNWKIILVPVAGALLAGITANADQAFDLTPNQNNEALNLNDNVGDQFYAYGDDYCSIYPELCGYTTTVVVDGGWDNYGWGGGWGRGWGGWGRGGWGRGGWGRGGWGHHGGWGRGGHGGWGGGGHHGGWGGGGHHRGGMGGGGHRGGRR